jgi:DNA-binding cell septation regulator SpoVG
MKITEIEIIPIKPRNGLVAFASIVVENRLYLGSIGVHTRLDGSGYRLTYPTKKIGDRDLNIFHPIDQETSKKIEEAIITKMKKIFK